VSQHYVLCVVVVMSWHVKKNAGGEGGEGGVDWMAAKQRRKMWQRFAGGPCPPTSCLFFLAFGKHTSVNTYRDREW